MTPFEKIVNVQTGEEVIREYSASEIALFESDAIRLENEANERIEAKAKRNAALAKLEALGLSEDDLKALGL